ncbi:FtsL-like putative cell division protein [Crocinitomix sp.]|nr:FtsL-like putative cell division protein [Crocinitomix sp.]
MSNEFIDKEDIDAREALKAVKEKKQADKKSTRSRRSFVQIMNGEFLSKDNFVQNLPFIFFLGFLLVILISWGYYAETITRKEVRLEKELGELNSEYFTLGSEYNSKRGRRSVGERLEGTGVGESLTSPRKIRVKKFVFEDGK